VRRRGTVAVYYVDPIEGGRRRKFVLPNAHHEQVVHYEWVAEQLANRAPHRSVGLYDFAEEDLATGQVGPATGTRIIQPGGIRAIRIENEVVEAVPVQGDLLEGTSA
jgi:hypothetical protein